MRRVLTILSVTMITAGLTVLADAGLTLAWKEPVSALYGKFRQNEARGQLDDLEASFLQGSEAEALARIPDPARRAERLADLFEEDLQTGKAIGRIEVPVAGINYVVVQGTDTEALKKGPGHYPDTALPGQGKTIGIAGHRTTYGAPFNQIDKIGEGDEITLEMPYATFTYEVEKTEIVEPTQTEIVDNIGRERLVLTACHPLYSAAQRFAVFARLTDIALDPG